MTEVLIRPRQNDSAFKEETFEKMTVVFNEGYSSFKKAINYLKFFHKFGGGIPDFTLYF